MLIILNAMSTIGVKFIAHEFIKVFNSQTIDDFFVEFNPMRVTDKDGNVVYDIKNVKNELITTNPILFEKIIKLDNELRDLSHKEHYRDGQFDDFYFDYGITDYLRLELFENAPEFFGGVLGNSNYGASYQKTLDNYLNRPATIRNYVISGQFSKTIIEKFQNDLEDVVVINFIRNPSTTIGLHLEDDDYFLDKSKADYLDKDYYYLRLFESIMTTISAMSVKNVINLKFEDFLKNGFIEIANKKIFLPKIHNNFNNLVTYWEKEKLIKTKICTLDTVNYYNIVFSDIEKSIDEFFKFIKFNIKYELIDLYEEKIKNGETVPPICLHSFNNKTFITDGYHKLIAYKNLCIDQVPVFDGKNNFTMNLNELLDYLKNDPEYEYNESDKNRLLNLLPTNIFDSLGYQPLTLSQLIRRAR